MKIYHQGQAALEFLTTYGWAFLVILIMIAALSYFGILSPSKILPDRCNFGPEIGCINHLIGTNGVSLKLKNNAEEPIVVASLAISTEKIPLSCSSPLIGSTWKPAEIKDVPISCDFTNSGLTQGEKGKLNLKLSYYLVRSSSSFAKDVQGEVYTTVSSSLTGLGVSKIRVLSIYPCGCLIDDIIANYGTVSGYPQIEVTCVQRDSFTPSYDLSQFDVVAFDGADCWPGTISSGSEQNVERFVNTGGGAIFGHDFFLGNKHIISQPVAGFSRVDTCCQGTAFNKLLDDSVTRVPYALPNPIPTQCTHGSGEVQRPESKEQYGSTDVYDHYLITYQYGSGRSVFTEWGHCAYDCGCGLNGGMPAADESKSLINAIYWAAGVTT